MRPVKAGSILFREGLASTALHVDAKTAEDFVKEFKKLVESEGYLLQQVFYCDETGLFWNKISKRTYITVEDTKDARPQIHERPA